MDRKIVGYVGVGIIGVGFIMMAASNTLHSEVGSVLQTILGAVFIAAAVIKTAAARKRKG